MLLTHHQGDEGLGACPIITTTLAVEKHFGREATSYKNIGAKDE